MFSPFRCLPIETSWPIVMKKNARASLEGLLKNRSLVLTISLFLMTLASLSIMLCEKEMIALENKWRSLYEIKELQGDADNKSIAESQPQGPTRYDIKVSLARSGGRGEIQFCDKYSLMLFENRRPSGVYYKTGQSPGKYVSTAMYPQGPMAGISENLNVSLKCDLIEKTALIYINGDLREKIRLGSGPVSYDFGLGMQRGRKKIVLNKLEISDHAGRVLFRADFAAWSFCKLLSQTALFLGVLILLVFACSEKLFLRRALFFVSLLFFLEIFLRSAYPHSPDLDIEQLKPKWLFGITTNFYGAFNDPREISIHSYFGVWRAYSIENPEHALRIICVGSSPLAERHPSVGQTFPAFLEKEINRQSKRKSLVIPAAIPQAEHVNRIEPSIFLKELLSRWTPDILLYYGKLTSTDGKDYKKYFEKDLLLYHRAKEIISKNSDWIKNDRLLYAALEFKAPVREVVYLYSFLCKSYLFMALENIRKKIFGEWASGGGRGATGRPEAFFEEVLRLCEEKGIKVVFIPQLDFSTCSNDKQTENILKIVREQHPEIYGLSLEGVFAGNRNFLLAEDRSHPSEYGHQVMAREIFRQLTEKGLLNINQDL